jgi:hypothetical protein
MALRSLSTTGSFWGNFSRCHVSFPDWRLLSVELSCFAHDDRQQMTLS